MTKKSKKRIISLFLFLNFMVGTVLSFPINANAADNYTSGIVLGSDYTSPINVLVDNSGNNIYIAEYSSSGRIIKVDKEGKNGTTIASSLNQPIGMVFDSNGDLYVALHNGRKIIKIDNSTGQVSDVATGFTGNLTGIVFDTSKQYFYVADYNNGKIIKVKKDGSTKSDFATSLGNNSIIGLAIDSSDNLYVSDRASGGIKKVDTSGSVTSFKTGLSMPTWITRDGYGYFYVSESNRSIKKLDESGAIITNFSTGSNSPWGVTLDSSGYIYFVGMNTSLFKIVGKGNVIGGNQIVLEMNNELVGTAADPTAFTLHGIASNPTVTNAEISGKNVTLTLSSEISNSDSSIKVDYTKSGTNNMTGNMAAGSTVELDSFVGLPVQNSVRSITYVSALANINAAYGTTQGELALPQNVSVGLSNSTTTSAAIIWNNGNPNYDGNTAGTYEFTGTLTLQNGVANPANLKATVNVIVSDSGYVSQTTPAAVTIKGNTKVGNTLTAQLLTEENIECTTSASVTYNWYRLNNLDSDFSNKIGSGITYNLTNNDIGKYIGVSATYNEKTFYAKSEKITSNAQSNSSSSSSSSSSKPSLKDELTTNKPTSSDEGWKQNSADWKYLKNGQAVTGWNQINGQWYLMDSAGTMLTGWKYSNEQWYLLKDNGAMATGWQQTNGQWYLLKDNGAMVTGWQQTNGQWYLLKDNGAMATGWHQVNGVWYLLKDNGAMAIGWQQTNGKWYYLYTNGYMASNTVIDGYEVDANGAWIN